MSLKKISLSKVHSTRRFIGKKHWLLRRIHHLKPTKPHKGCFSQYRAKAELSSPTLIVGGETLVFEESAIETILRNRGVTIL